MSTERRMTREQTDLGREAILDDQLESVAAMGLEDKVVDRRSCRTEPIPKLVLSEFSS